MRMTRTGSSNFEGFFHNELQSLGADCMKALPDCLLSVVLGGGYGRGEGAVVHQNGREMPYNDLDLFLVFNKRLREVPSELDEVQEKWEHCLGIDVDFSRPLWPGAIRRWPAALMWHDLALGHRVLAGSDIAISQNVPAHVLEHPGPIEALRLLLNRGAGLLWTREVMANRSPSPDADFIRRNVQKAFLASGDAILLAHGLHHHLVEQRDQRFRNLEKKDPAVASLGLAERYSQACIFKSSPDELPAETTQEDWNAARRSWITSLLHSERVRTGKEYPSLKALLADDTLREPEKNQWWQRPINLLKGLRQGRISSLYPREELYRTLPAMLEATEPVAKVEKTLQIWRGVA